MSVVCAAVIILTLGAIITVWGAMICHRLDKIHDALCETGRNHARKANSPTSQRVL